MNAKRFLITVLLSTLSLAASVSCSKEEEDKVDFVPELAITGSRLFTFSGEGGNALLKISANCPWEIAIPADATWVTADIMSGGSRSEDLVSYKVNLTIAPMSGPKRTAVVAVRYGESYKNVTINQSSLAESSQFNIPDDMLFSTTLGRNTTNVCQGFDYDPDGDIIYISSKYGTYQNHLGWQKRETASSTTVAPDYMTLRCFSHGNNISIEKASDGKKYVWAPNYADRQSDGSYDKPKIVSRFPLVSGKTLYNTDTEENYYFGLNVTWPAFDFKNDMMAVCDYSYFYIYKLSDIMALPVETITLDFKITYGGASPVQTNIPEWSGNPVVKARDCRKVKAIYKVPFTYKQRNLHWQSYCIDNGWIFAILSADTKEAPEIIHDTYVEAYKMDGSDNKYKIRQEYMQNRDRIVEFGWNEKDYFYCEPEGIKVQGNTMYMLYCMRGNTEAHKIRRPVIFKLASPVQQK